MNTAALSHAMAKVWRDTHDASAVLGVFLLGIAIVAAIRAAPLAARGIAKAARSIANGNWEKSREAARRRAAIDVHLKRSSRPLLHLLGRESSGVASTIDSLATDHVVSELDAAVQELRTVMNLLRDCGAPVFELDWLPQHSGATRMINSAEQRLRSSGSASQRDVRALVEAHSELDRAAQHLAEQHSEIDPWIRGCRVPTRRPSRLQDAIWGR